MSHTALEELSRELHGLYSPTMEKDSCGFALLCQMDDEPSHSLVQTSIQALTRLSHRGAIAPDGKTGDGCGILIKTPKSFFSMLASEAGLLLPDMFAVGMVFLNQDKLLASNALTKLKKEIQEVGLEVAWTRPVPTNNEACGEEALLTLPQIVQLIVTAPKASEASQNPVLFDRKLYIARRKTEIALSDKDPMFYVASLSCRTVIYKGMVMPQNLPIFYPDLNDERFTSSLCMVHQRFSTNTMPEWRLAQPFRFLAHNGEINTIRGNQNWSISRETKYTSPLIQNIEELYPLVTKDGSDSMSLDNMLEALVAGGMDFLLAMRVLIPPAWQNLDAMDQDLRAMYEYYSLYMDPWDGPAALILSNGDVAACALDRNGLRPARYMITGDRVLTVGSEIGIVDYAPESIIAKGRLRPGEMIAVDLNKGEFLLPKDIDEQLKKRHPYKQWLDQHARYLESTEEEETGSEPIFEHELLAYKKQFMVTQEEVEHVLTVLAETNQEPVMSMGDDVPLAVMSKQVRSLYDYFRQQFAQVTNPPIDPIREQLVMSVRTSLGKEKNPFGEIPEYADRIDIPSPVLSKTLFKSLLQLDDPAYAYETIDLTYPSTGNLKDALIAVCDRAEQAVQSGKVILILSDRRINKNRLPIHALLATGAVHARLSQKGLRCDANILVETGTARDPHHFAALIGYGATAIYPYLAYQCLYELYEKNILKPASKLNPKPVSLMRQYQMGIQKGLYKIMSKMGIATINSYRGAQLFEALGLASEVIDLCFPGTISRIEGARFEDLETDMRQLSKEAWAPNKAIRLGGQLRFQPNSEYHAFNPDVVQALQQAVEDEDQEAYNQYTDLVNHRSPMTLRDLLQVKLSNQPVPLNEVEPIEAIVRRFDTAAMSLGSLSPEAHEALAIAMNRLGGRSNSGEGGEDPARFGTEKVSKIKQVASGRFGVTPAYLSNAEVIQIKLAQGAKPGEGGQLPGHKVNELIAKLRYTRPGTPLISPPPHHDIYSIEDLAQLIFDLKQVNPQAMISVKLVSSPGVGTIAAGVAKTYADLITISGHDGGTGASPMTSVKYAGSPWELGLVETHHVLRANNLRDKVRVQADGGLKTGLDVIKATLLGAESYGFGTAPLIVLGCKYLRICHLNNCATGVATQNNVLRERHFKGLPEKVETYFRFVAEEIREWLSKLGVRSLDELIGRVDLLERIPGETSRQQNLMLEGLLASPASLIDKPHRCLIPSNPPYDKGELAEQMVRDTLPAIEHQTGGIFAYTINNTNRSIGARISGEIAKRYSIQGLKQAPIHIQFKGTAGQSFGVWNSPGLNLSLEGDSNDYVGKGMAGGKIVIYPPKESKFDTQTTPIIGNICLYGATGGKLFAAGMAGERFAIRNSGATAVVEGVGDHGCEYMTGGVVTVLGKVGYNFGAGMTGGMAFVLDQSQDFVNRYNHELVDIHRINVEYLIDYADFLENLIQEFVSETGSPWGQTILQQYSRMLGQFWLVKPKAAELDTLLRLMEIAA